MEICHVFLNKQGLILCLFQVKTCLDTNSNLPGLIDLKLLCKKPGLKDNIFQVRPHVSSFLFK